MEKSLKHLIISNRKNIYGNFKLKKLTIYKRKDRRLFPVSV